MHFIFVLNATSEDHIGKKSGLVPQRWYKVIPENDPRDYFAFLLDQIKIYGWQWVLMICCVLWPQLTKISYNKQSNLVKQEKGYSCHLLLLGHSVIQGPLPHIQNGSPPIWTSPPPPIKCCFPPHVPPFFLKIDNWLNKSMNK